MKIPLPDNLGPIARAFSGAGVPVYAVGGLVRNTLLRLPPSDVDICSALTPEQVETLCQGTTLRVIPKAPAFGTVEIHGPGGLTVEHTTFRSDSYPRGGAHQPDRVVLGGTLKTDAFRRDFTVNALYADLFTGEIQDPTGGLRDLTQKLLRTTSPDPEEILGSDALRVLRLVRFSAELDFSPEEETFQAARRYGKQLSQIAPERLRQELEKILLCDGRYPGRDGRVLTALERLDQLSAWETLFPDLARCRGLEQRKDYHRYDVLTHSFHVCAETPPVEKLRLAGLLHDIGKAQCLSDTGNLHAHAAYSTAIARRDLTNLRYPTATIQTVCALVEGHMFDLQNTAREDTLRVRFAAWGRERTRDMILLREADIRGSGYETAYMQTRWRTLYEIMLADGTPFSMEELAVTGREIMDALDMAAGPEVGRVKERLFAHCARFPGDNTRERLLARLKDFQ